MATLRFFRTQYLLGLRVGLRPGNAMKRAVRSYFQGL